MTLPPWHIVHPAHQWMAWNLMQEELDRQHREHQQSGPEMSRLRATIAQLERQLEED